MPIKNDFGRSVRCPIWLSRGIRVMRSTKKRLFGPAMFLHNDTRADGRGKNNPERQVHEQQQQPTPTPYHGRVKNYFKNACPSPAQPLLAYRRGLLAVSSISGNQRCQLPGTILRLSKSMASTDHVCSKCGADTQEVGNVTTVNWFVNVQPLHTSVASLRRRLAP